MIHVVLTSENIEIFSELIDFLNDNEINSEWVNSQEKLFSMISDKKIDLIITGEKACGMTGIQLIEKIVMKNPMINCAAISSLSQKDFHEESEGLGILVQLPAKPSKKDAEKLLEHLLKITNQVS